LLSKHERGLIAKSSRHAIEAAAGSLGRYVDSGDWLAAGNRYRRDPYKAVNADSPNLDAREMSQYVAASVPLHCADGWGYLGRAIQSHVRGDPDTARHLAYYAELRAGLAILASEGIGIFNTRQVVVDTSSTVIEFPKRRRPLGTHVAVWLILEEWATLQRSVALLEELIEVADASLHDWLREALQGAAWTAVGHELFERWGLDLKRLAKDKAARNEASYQPTGLVFRSQLSPRDAAEFLCSLWSALEPTRSAPFEYLDRHLLRLALEEAADASRGTPDARATLHERSVTRAVDELLAGQPRKDEMRRFLLREGDYGDDTALLGYAAGASPSSDEKHHLEVISRATLLLRIASGASRRMLYQAGLTANRLEWWWTSFGTERGLWPISPSLEDRLDEWLELSQAINDLEHFAATPPASYFAVLDECAQAISRLAGSELVPVWSLAA
jgi:hypothetical protein